MEKARLHLRSLIKQREILDRSIELAKKDYAEKCEEGAQCLFMTDHAIVRYIQRVLGDKLPESHLGEKDMVTKYITRNGLDSIKFRNTILTPEEQLDILKRNTTFYTKGEWTYVIRNYTLVSVIPKKEKWNNG